MRTMIIAAVAAIGLTPAAAAYAGEGEGPVSNTLFTENPGGVAEAPTQNVPSIAMEVARTGRCAGRPAAGLVFPFICSGALCLGTLSGAGEPPRNSMHKFVGPVPPAPGYRRLRFA